MADATPLPKPVVRPMVQLQPGPAVQWFAYGFIAGMIVAAIGVYVIKKRL